MSFRIFQDGNSVIHACFSVLIESGALSSMKWCRLAVMSPLRHCEVLYEVQNK